MRSRAVYAPNRALPLHGRLPLSLMRKRRVTTAPHDTQCPRHTGTPAALGSRALLQSVARGGSPQRRRRCLRNYPRARASRSACCRPRAAGQASKPLQPLRPPRPCLSVSTAEVAQSVPCFHPAPFPIVCRESWNRGNLRDGA